MDFGKLPFVNRVNFRLPEDDPRNLEVLKPVPSAAPTVFVGAPIWNQKSWKGSLYPTHVQPKEYLEHYCRQLNTVELNTTFYQIPDEKTVLQWKNASTPGFKFCPKFPQQITHDFRLQDVKVPTDLLWKSFRHLHAAGRLGLGLLQLPPQFGIQELPSLARYLRSLPKEFRVAVELRHPECFAGGKLHGAIRSILQATETSTVITDVAGRRDVSHSTLTTSSVFIRFVGNELHPTDFTRIDAWVLRLKQWINQGLHEIYFFVHQPEDLDSPELIRYFIDRMNSACNLKIKNWSPASGTQLGLF